MAARINAKEMIDNRPFGAYQFWIILLCFLAATVDGYDTQIIGVAVPGIRETLHLQPATIGIILTAGQIGVMLGAFCLGPVADRIGRRAMLIITPIIFGFFSLLIAFATSVEQLVVLRVLSGLGMGGIVPAAMAFASEYAPHRLRATVTTLVWMALPVGGMIGGFSAVWLIPAYGWQSLFIVAGILPLIMAVVLAIALPDSLAYLSASGAAQTKLRAIARRIDPAIAAQGDVELYWNEEKLPGVPLKHLFTEGRMAGTLLLWVIFFLSFFLMIWFISWVPSLVRMSGAAATTVGTTLAAWNIGSLLATALIGRLIDKLGYYRILPVCFALIFVAMMALGYFISAPYALVAVLVGTVGFFTGGSNSGLMALAASSYPVAIRSTGMGAAYAIGGRSGALCGPMLGGVLLQMGWAPPSICYLMATPMLLGVLVLLLLRRQAQFRHEVSGRLSVAASSA